MNLNTLTRTALAALLALPLTLSACGDKCPAPEQAAACPVSDKTAALPAAKDGKSTVAEDGTIVLPVPDKEGGAPLMKAISDRKSSRAYSPKMISDQELSDLVWVAAGINRPEKGGITIPTAMGSKEIDVYVMTREGVFFYKPENHQLVPVVKGDHRNIAGKQEFAAQAPVTLFLVADEARMKAKDDEAKKSFGSMTAAYASENIYLYCASKGLSTVARAAIDKAALGELLKLRPEQKLLLAQSVGYAPEG